MKEIAVEVIPEEIRMVLVEDGKLERVYYERSGDEHVVNRIYKGIIRNILPGMEAAFVDIGTGRNAYLKLKKPIQEHYGKRLFVGQSLLVQIVKEEMLGKAARVTTDVSLAGRFIVLLPFSKGVHISKRITDDELRNDLKNMVGTDADDNWGFIIRTCAAQASKEELLQDLEYLINTYKHIDKRFKLAKGGTELYRDADFWLRLVRDYVTKDVDRILVDSLGGYERLKDLLKFSVEASKVELYEGEKPLFEALQVEDELDNIANANVPLPSGGELRLERTEALTVIDVNSKSYTGQTADVSDTALAVNREAAKEVCRQLRLRDIGGIIIVDFIDMHKEEYNKELINLLRKECQQDPVKTVVCGMTNLGLVEITRKREKQGIQELLTDTCSACGGSGYLLSAQTIYLQIVRKILGLYRSGRIKSDLLIEVHSHVKPFFTKKVCSDLEDSIHRSIRVESTDVINREAYSILTL